MNELSSAWRYPNAWYGGNHGWDPLFKSNTYRAHSTVCSLEGWYMARRRLSSGGGPCQNLLRVYHMQVNVGERELRFRLDDLPATFLAWLGISDMLSHSSTGGPVDGCRLQTSAEEVISQSCIFSLALPEHLSCSVETSQWPLQQNRHRRMSCFRGINSLARFPGHLPI